MVCEICGSQSIRKDNGVFVCQECGTEYSVEEAKKLLRDFDEQDNLKQNQTSNQNTAVSGKDKLLSALSLWVLNLSKMPDVLLWFNIPRDKISTDQFWKVDLLRISTKTFPAYFPTLPETPLFLSRLANGGGEFWIKSWEPQKPWWNKWKSEHPDSYRRAKESYDLAYRFYGKECSISEIIEEEAANASFQNKMTDFFAKYDQYTYNGRVLYTMFPSIIGNSKFVPGEGLIITKKNPCISELSVQYNTYVRNNDNIKLCTVEKGFFKDKIVSAPDSVTNTFRAMLKAGSDIVLEFISKHNEMMHYCSEHFSDICDLMNEVKNNCLKLESELFVPYKYRSIPVLLNLIDLVNDGKASTWQDLINLYDTHQYRIGVYEKLDAINSKLDVIQNTLIIGFTAIAQQLSEVNSSLQSITSKIDAINSNLISIKKYNFITMWNSL